MFSFMMPYPGLVFCDERLAKFHSSVTLEKVSMSRGFKGLNAIHSVSGHRLDSQSNCLSLSLLQHRG